MLLELLALLPERWTHASPMLAMAGSVVGVVFWLAGGRFSREIVTLALVTVGGVVGMHLPQWCGWSVDGMGLAFAGALVLGVSGYWLDKAWTGGLLAGVLALWAGVGCWLWVGADVTWHWPMLAWRGDQIDLLMSLWRAMPVEAGRVMPFAVGAGLIAGVCAAVLWPRIARATLFSLMGLSLIIVVGLPGLIRSGDAAALRVSAGAPLVPLLTLLGMAVVGIVLQLWLMRGEENRQTKAVATAPPAAGGQRAAVVAPVAVRAGDGRRVMHPVRHHAAKAAA